MSDYKPYPELLPDELVSRAKKLGTALLCDGMNGMGVERNGALDAQIMPVDSTMVMAGTACTVETGDGDNFPIHVAVYQGKPGYVMMIAGQGYMHSAYLGDLIAGAANAIGFEGMVVDGCIRDRLGLKELGMPMFARGYMQCSPAKRGPGKINTPVACAGAQVNPGDLVVGDCDGVVVIPRHLIEAVLEKAETKLIYET
ncbi:MAG: RraA family protein, partial [Clostridia bacterium]|nr:RraA family protein [Clostridia bacterium]